MIIHDGPHPFYSWKVITFYYCFCLQASIHLVILEVLQDRPSVKWMESYPLITVASFTPLTLLLCDWFANRIYFPLTIVGAYSIVCYSLGVLVTMLQSDLIDVNRVPEMSFFAIKNTTLAWSLPIFVTVGVYLVTRFKFWYLGEGDIVFDFNKWAKSAQMRMDYIEGDSKREELAYKHFYNETKRKEQELDYEDPDQVDQYVNEKS